jgi:hypothetical protein
MAGARKDNGKGRTIHTVAEVVRKAAWLDVHREFSRPRHGTKYISAMQDTLATLPPQPTRRGRSRGYARADHGLIVRVTWDGVSHERRLYEVGRNVRPFTWPSPSSRGPAPPNYRRMHAAERRKWLRPDEVGVEGIWRRLRRKVPSGV